MKILRSIGQLVLIWIAIIVTLIIGAVALSAIDPLKDVPQVVATRGSV